MTYLQYTGHEVMTYMGFIDVATGKTLTCTPGKSYEITPASGSVGDVPNDGRFILMETAGSTWSPENTTVTVIVPDLPEGGEE